MGKPIVYCDQCGRSLREDDFDRGRAHNLNHRPYCTDCRPAPPPASPSRASSTRVQPLPGTPKRGIPTIHPATPGRPIPLPLWIGGGVALLAIILAGVGASRRSIEEVPHTPSPALAPIPPPPAVARVERPPPERLEVERKMAEEVELQKKAHLDRFLGEIRDLVRAPDLAQRRGEIEGMLIRAERMGEGRKTEIDAIREQLAMAVSEEERKKRFVACWKLDETEGARAADATESGHHGKVVGKVAWEPGRVAGGMAFDGKGGHVEMRAVGTLVELQENSYTVMAWFKPLSIPPGKGDQNNAAQGIVVRSGKHAGLKYTASGFSFEHWLLGDKGATAASKIPHAPGSYYHVVGVVDRPAGETRLYVDGILEARSTWEKDRAGRKYGTEPWRIGIGKPGATKYAWPAHAIIDDVRLYSRAVSLAEIQAVHRSAP